MESYYCKNYEVSLIESILRTPTSHTLWMFNRVVNDKNASEKNELVDMFKEVIEMDIADDIIETAREFLDFQQR